jgi:hypothetical protein
MYNALRNFAHDNRVAWARLIIGIFAAITMSSAHASSGLVDQATILNLQPTTLANSLGQAGGYFVYVSISPGGPSCATFGQSSHRFVANPNTPSGMAIISTLLTAFALGRNVQITGTGICDIWGDTESIAAVYTE